MQGKIALEEHFAVEETLGDSLPFVPPDYQAELEHRLFDFHDKRLGLMDKHGIEMMILSLNAPAVQAIPDPKKATDLARRANDALAEVVRSARTASRGSPRSRCRTWTPPSREYRSAASRSSASAARWSTASRRSSIRTAPCTSTCRSTGRSGRKSRSSTSVLPASAQPAADPRADLRGPPVAARPRPGRSARRPRCTRCA